MPVSVVDASALAALAFAEPDAEHVVARLGDDELVAPSLLWHEMANVCVRKIRIHPTERGKILDAFRMATTLDIRIVDVDRVAVVERAEATGLTAYDAAYLWLAERLGARLVTLDRRLAEAVFHKRRHTRGGENPHQAWNLGDSRRLGRVTTEFWGFRSV